MPKKAISFVGRQFNKLFVVSEAKPGPQNRVRYLCRCVCGREIVVDRQNLKCGGSRQCRICASTGPRRKYGKSHPLYHIWTGIIGRCCNHKNKRFRDYGGRGITICDRWRQKGGFINFVDDMGMRPTDSHEIERKDNNGPYSPENCKWATQTEQQRNKRTSRFVTFNGITLTVAEWAEKLGIPPYRIYSRIYNGHSPEKSLSVEIL